MENSITELELGEYGNVKENMNQIFNCIPQMNRLEKLKISVRFQLSDFEMFQRALVHSNITELEFRRTSTGRQLVLALAAVLPKTKLKVLSFFSTNTGEKELKELASSLPHSSVTELNLTLYNFPDISHGFTNLKILSIWIPESAINIRWLFDALPHLCLSELECYSEIDIQSYPSLFVNLPKSQISKLSIPINHQYSDFICSVAQSKVRYLSVFSTEANAICKAISDTRSFKLESLRISDTVTSEGLEYLLQGLQVRELDLEFNEIGDAGLQVIEELISNTRIKKLNVLDSEGDCLILRNALQYLTHLQIDVKDIEFMSHIGNLKVLKIACDEALKRQIYRLSSKYPKTIIDFVESH
ncbi:hypothetical protein HDV04_001380 [Boothiomyces sp. JEL0838]|nr:hypothetical protein HDV04_001380 [Boothiomyces sp. JEL0838]